LQLLRFRYFLEKAGVKMDPVQEEIERYRRLLVAMGTYPSARAEIDRIGQQVQEQLELAMSPVQNLEIEQALLRQAAVGRQDQLNSP
jgi:hypothetical protein